MHHNFKHHYGIWTDGASVLVGVFAGVNRVAGVVTPSVIVMFLLLSLRVFAVANFCGPMCG